MPTAPRLRRLAARWEHKAENFSDCFNSAAWSCSFANCIPASAHELTAESALQVVASDRMAFKRAEPLPETLTTLPDGTAYLRFALGRSWGTPRGISLGGTAQDSIATSFGALVGLTDRLEWNVGTGAFAYRIGEAGGLELVPWGGLLGWGVGYSSVVGLLVQGSIGGGLSVRAPLTGRLSLILGSGFWSGFEWSQDRGGRAPRTWRNASNVGASFTFNDIATLNLALGITQNVLFDGEFPRAALLAKKRGALVAVGSVQALGLRTLPLLQVRMSDHILIDGDVSFARHLESGSTLETYMAGFTVIW